MFTRNGMKAKDKMKFRDERNETGKRSALYLVYQEIEAASLQKPFISSNTIFWVCICLRNNLHIVKCKDCHVLVRQALMNVYIHITTSQIKI
jgi:hypothetical protein